MRLSLSGTARRQLSLRGAHPQRNSGAWSAHRHPAAGQCKTKIVTI